MTRRDPRDLIAATAQLFDVWRRSGRTRIWIRPTAMLELPGELTQPV
jgi:hypothetical protein